MKLVTITIHCPDTLRLINPIHGVLSHANHFDDPDILGISEPVNPRRHLSEYRQKRMFTLLNEFKPLNVKDLQKILQDHNNNPQSLCRHRDGSLSESQHTITKTSMIMDLKEKKLWATNGQPCKTKFEVFSLN